MATAIQCRRDHARRPSDGNSISSSSDCSKSFVQRKSPGDRPRRRRARRQAATARWLQTLLLFLAVAPTVGLGVGIGLRAKRAIPSGGVVASAAQPDVATGLPTAPAPASKIAGTAAVSSNATTTAPVNVFSIRRGYPETFRQIKRPLSEQKLKDQIALAPEIVLESKPGEAARALLEHARHHRSSWMIPAPEASLLTSRADLAGLPLRKGAECYLFTTQAISLEWYSEKLHTYLAEAKSDRDQFAGTPYMGHLRGVEYVSARMAQDGNGVWRKPDAAPAVVQVLQAEDVPYRRLLVQLLAGMSGEAAAEALARRAAFDISPIVREEAVFALRARRENDYRGILLDALRHPWPAAAEFAAEAIVNLNLTSTIPELVALLSQPSPSEPVAVKSGNRSELVVRELVQLNHLKNCLLCHAASADASDRVRGLVPDPDRLPTTSRTEYYRGSGLFARAEVTYLVQDFSVVQPVVESAKRVRHERFDYVVRTRTAIAAEAMADVGHEANYPQRDSVLFALREMTGVDLGRDARMWAQAMPR